MGNTDFGCTQCGKCCRDTKVPLTVAEAMQWLSRGDEVQLLCEASLWPEALDGEPRAAHFKRRSFPVMSGSMPARVVVMLVANVVGACPNLLSDLRCGIYADRPLVCRIYPAEINPLVALMPQNKACPPEAWAEDQPVLLQGGVLRDETIRRDIELSRAADALDADLKYRLCLGLNLAHTALVHEAVLVYSPAANTLLSALAAATASASDSAKNRRLNGASCRINIRPWNPWRRAAQPHFIYAMQRRPLFNILRFKREPLFGFNAERESVP